MDRRITGRRGELAALLLLLAKGYRPRHRNWRGAGGELDIVVTRGREIVFVEVKTRSSELFGGAISAVDREKQRRLKRVSAAYLTVFDLWDRPSRFDIVTIERRSGFPYWHIRHYRNAFTVDRGRQL
jgi:putative endonuclease